MAKARTSVARPKAKPRAADKPPKGTGRIKADRIGPEQWLLAAIEALGQGGIDAVKVEPLARRLGVTKGSFYHHFKGRAALLEALLERWQAFGTELIIQQVESTGGDARERMRVLWGLTSADGNMQAELALRDWGRRDEHVAATIKQVDNARLRYLEKLFTEITGDADGAKARAMLAYSMLIGNHFIQGSHGRRSRGRVLKDAIELLLM